MWVRVTCLVALSMLQGACANFGKSAPPVIDCKAPQSSCHQGRFGLVWEVKQPDGTVNSNAVSGYYEWRSGREGGKEALERAYLEINSRLGPSLGSAKRYGDFFEVRVADGRVYLAHDWQSLFNLMFPVQLPAQALVQWMENPNPHKLPILPMNWSWENQNERYRIVFQENNISGRIDLIPQVRLDQ